MCPAILHMSSQFVSWYHVPTAADSRWLIARLGDLQGSASIYLRCAELVVDACKLLSDHQNTIVADYDDHIQSYYIDIECLAFHKSFASQTQAHLPIAHSEQRRSVLRKASYPQQVNVVRGANHVCTCKAQTISPVSMCLELSPEQLGGCATR